MGQIYEKYATLNRPSVGGGGVCLEMPVSPSLPDQPGHKRLSQSSACIKASSCTVRHSAVTFITSHNQKRNV